MAEEESSEITIVETRVEQMVDHSCSNANQTPILRTAHFLKPTLSPNSTPPPFPKVSISPISSKPNIQFFGNKPPMKNWQTWVDSLRQAHESSWRKAGIFDAIMASTYHIPTHNEVIIALADKWCPETNTFVFPWGEVSITLEDVMILGGFSTLGDSVLCKSPVGENVMTVEKNLREYFRDVRQADHNTSHYLWEEIFMGRGDDIEHAAFCVLWLCRHVFQSKSPKTVTLGVFPVAVRLSCGFQIALAPSVLASIYRDLTLLKGRIVGGCGDGVSLKLTAPFWLLQAWAWERLPSLKPVPRVINWGEPRVARWASLGKVIVSDVEMVLDSCREVFVWRPYALSLENWRLPSFYVDSGTWVSVNSDEVLKSCACCLISCQLVGMNCVEDYFPHRVALQFGLDQDIPCSIPRLNVSSELYNVKLYLTPRLHEGDVTCRYSDWWRTGLNLNEVAPIGCKRQKRSVRRVKKLTRIIDEGKEGDSEEITRDLNPLSDDLRVLDIASSCSEQSAHKSLHESMTSEQINLVTNEEHEVIESSQIMNECGKQPQDSGSEDKTSSDNNIIEPLVAPEANISSQQPNTVYDRISGNCASPVYSPGLCDKSIVSGGFGNVTDIPYEGTSLCRGISSAEIPDVTVSPVLEQDSEDVNMKMAEGSQNLEVVQDKGGASSAVDGDVIVVTPDMNVLCCTLAEDGQAKASSQGTEINHLSNSVGENDITNAVIDVSDYEASVGDPFEAWCLELESKISMLETDISTIEVANSRRSVR